MRSVLDQWLVPDARDKRPLGVATADFMAIRREAERVRHLPHGERTRYLERVAERWNVSRRTVVRYLRYHVQQVTVNGWSAVYVVPDDAPPRRVTRWQATGARGADG